MKNVQRLASYRNLMFFCAKNETNGKYTTFITTVNNHRNYQFMRNERQQLSNDKDGRKDNF